MNSLEMLQALVFEPRKAFVALAERPRFLFPLLALILGTGGLVLWYYRVVDLEWFTDRQLRASAFAARLSEAQIEAQIKSAAARPGITASIATITTALGLVIGYLLVSVYYRAGRQGHQCAAQFPAVVRAGVLDQHAVAADRHPCRVRAADRHHGADRPDRAEGAVAECPVLPSHTSASQALPPVQPHRSGIPLRVPRHAGCEGLVGP